MAFGRRRRTFRIILALVIGLVFVALALPLWFPWALRPTAKSLGLNYAAYERNGYGRFSLSNVVWSSRSGAFHANRVEAFLPARWLSGLVRRETKHPFVQISDWNFRYQSDSNRTTSNSASVYTNFNRIDSTLETLAQWIPAAALTNGTVRMNTLTLPIPQARWTDGTLSARVILPENRSVQMRAGFLAGRPVTLSVESDALNARGAFSVTPTRTSLNATGTLFWLSNRIDLAASFPRHGALPETAQVTADSFEIPGELLQLNSYRQLSGSMKAIWSHQRFGIDLQAHASPPSSELPPLSLEARVSGDTNSALLEALSLSASGLSANFSPGTRIQFHPPFLTQPAALTLAIDLARQPWLAASGTLHGNAVLFPAHNEYPRITFQLTGNNVVLSNLQTRTLELEGEFNWPNITLASARVLAAENSSATLTGSLNLTNKTVSAGQLDYAGALGRELLPAGYSFDRATAHAQFSGPLAALIHSGKFEIVRAQLPHAKPMQLNATWTAAGLAFDPIHLALKSGNASLALAAQLSLSHGTNAATISKLQLETSKGDSWRLEKPFHVAFRKPLANRTNTWGLDLEPMQWTGRNGLLAMQGKMEWPERGNFRIGAQNLGSGLLADFLTATNFEGTIRTLAFQGGWTNGPVAFHLQSSAAFQAGLPFESLAQVNIDGGDQGLAIQQLSVSSLTQTVVHAEGTLPIFLKPAGTGDVVRVNIDAPLHLQAFTETNSLLWDELARVSGVQIVQPDLRCNVTGTWADPNGRVTLTAQRIRFTRAKQPLPEVKELDFHLDLNQQQAVVSQLTALVAGQPVTASAAVPLGGSFWRDLARHRTLPDWRGVTAQLQMEKAQLAAFAELIPETLAPQGEANVNLQLARGELHGEFSVTNAATRPIATLGSLQDIRARILFAGRSVVLTNVAAEIGGQPVTAHGSADLAESFWRHKRLPDFQLYARGTNVPLVRKPGAVMRANLDLAITNSAGTNTWITGTVRLRDSFFLSSLETLAPGKTTGPKRRPPYFSIEAEPLAHWRLGLQVEGDKFLSVRSPIFRGIISTTLRLEGTLKEPLALGEVRVDSGAVTFPFGSLDLKQGFVSLTSGNPFHPQLFVTAAAQRMGYDINMEVTGPIDQPVVQFSSSPPLSSEQIVLMLTTGQLPQGLGTTTTGQRAQGLALFVGKNLLTDLGIGGAGESRLTIRSGEQLTETGRSTYQIEYKLTDTLSLVGEYDRFDQYNLGLKWKVYSR